MRGRIIQVAMDNINRYGWRKFTINDIAKELGISKKTIYKYFDSKDEMISAVVDQYVELEKSGASMALEIDGTWSEKLQNVFGGFAPDKPVRVSDELKRFFPHEWNKIETMRKQRGDQIKVLFFKAMESGEIRSDVNPAVIELIVLSTMNALYDSSNLERIDMTFNQALMEFNKILFSGILQKVNKI